MLEAIRNNDIQALSQLEDISMDIEKLMAEVKEKVDMRDMMSEMIKQKEQFLDIERNNLVQNLFIELNVTRMFKRLNDRKLRDIAQEVVNRFGADADYSDLQQEAFTIALNQNQQKKEKTQENTQRDKAVSKRGNDLRAIFEEAISLKTDVYDILKERGYIKDPVKEFFSAGNFL